MTKCKTRHQEILLPCFENKWGGLLLSPFWVFIWCLSLAFVMKVLEWKSRKVGGFLSGFGNIWEKIRVVLVFYTNWLLVFLLFWLVFSLAGVLNGGLCSWFQVGVSVNETKWGGKFLFLLWDIFWCESVTLLCGFYFSDLVLVSKSWLPLLVT